MKFHLVTIFPEFFEGPLRHGVVAKAAEAGKLEIQVHDLRRWTHDRHRTVDDRVFGGGEGMLLKCEPLFAAVEEILPGWQGRNSDPDRRVALLSASGRMFDQEAAERLSRCRELVLLCGRYEGVDERVAEHLADEEISIGDFVLSGGELAAAVIVDSVARLLPGVLGNEDSAKRESFSHRRGRLDCPQYTRPAEFRGWKVPEVLVSGHHAAIEKWREQAAREKTARNRPDLLELEDFPAKPEGNTVF